MCAGNDVLWRRQTATFAAVVTGEGEVLDYLRMAHMRLRRNSPIEGDAKKKEKDLDNLKKLIVKRRPHVIVLGVEDRYMLCLWLKSILFQWPTDGFHHDLKRHQQVKEWKFWDWPGVILVFSSTLLGVRLSSAAPFPDVRTAHSNKLEIVQWPALVLYLPFTSLFRHIGLKAGAEQTLHY